MFISLTVIIISLMIMFISLPLWHGYFDKPHHLMGWHNCFDTPYHLVVWLLLSFSGMT